MGCSAFRRRSSSGATAASSTSKSARSTPPWWSSGCHGCSRPLRRGRGRGWAHRRTPLPRVGARGTCAALPSSQRRVARRAATSVRQRGLVVAALAWLCVAIAPAAAQTTPDSSLDAKARDVAATLRCPVCQNLSIQDSPSLLAQDMKRLVRERLAAGETPDQVRRYFVSRYGEWVLLKPRASGVDLSVWLLPLLALVGGAVLVWSAVRRWIRQGDAARAAPAPVLAPEAAGEEELRARRTAVQASLRELQAEFAAGRLAPSDLAVLKQRDETELTALNAALKQVHKDRPGAGAGGGAPERAESATPPPRATTVRRWPKRLGWGAGLAAFAVVAVLSLKGWLGARPEGGTITGTQFAPPGEGSDGSPLQVTGPLDSLRITQLEARVRRDSTDVPALVELGHLYLM